MRFDKLCREISSLKDMNYIKTYCYNKLLANNELIDIYALIDYKTADDRNLNNNIISNFECIVLSMIDFYNEEYISNVCSMIDNGTQIENWIRQKGLSLYNSVNYNELQILSNELLMKIIMNIKNSINLLRINNQVIQQILIYIFDNSYQYSIRRKINPDYNFEINGDFSSLKDFIEKFRLLNKRLEEKVFSENNYEYEHKKMEIEGGKFIENGYDIDEMVRIIRGEI